MKLRESKLASGGVLAAICLMFLAATELSAAYQLTVGVAPFKHSASTVKAEEKQEVETVAEVEEEDDGPLLIPGLEGQEIEIPEAEKTEEEAAVEKQAEVAAAIAQPDFERASLEIRNAEALALQNYFSKMLYKKGGDLFASVINAPVGMDAKSSFAAAVDLWVEVTVEAANAEDFVLVVRATTSAGETLLNQKKIGEKMSEGAFVDSKNRLTEGYHEPLSEAAEAVVRALRAKNRKGDYDRYENFTNMKFAIYMAPEVFVRDNYLNKRGTKLKSLPSEDDPYFRESLEARLATIEIYRDFDEEVVAAGRTKSYASYAVWRYRSYLAANEYYEAQREIKALKGRINAAIALKLLGPIVINEALKKNNVAEDLGLGSDFEKVQDAAVIIHTLKTLSDVFTVEDGRIQFDDERLGQMDSNFAKKFTERRAKIQELSVDSNGHAEKLIALQKEFSEDLAPIDIEYRGRSFTLTGQIEDKVAMLQRILSEDYQESMTQS
ncbi:hypothetical protein [Pelagicoccus mobilis]|uniref:Uncharacterized protein n=1 Tax=Pelagicoccus mobilis TaxID=415221 RepID=A0A934RX92_9BACT|nr:hypothetical protein [Pelagicoccus mobilis]MBK1878008.1 hypothetical protein [Pelagicoccus mobilis]